MPLNSSFQLSLELTKLFGLTRQAASATQALVNFAKQLRNSGSDIVVEEDLANVFGRMRIEYAIETDFKGRVLIDTTIVPLYQQCEIQLQYGPGPTVQRACRDQDRRYLSTVVQLSMLASIHDRTELASAISESLNKRSAAGLPGATISPGFEGILKTLEACASQTSTFIWYGYTQSVRNQLEEVLSMDHRMTNAYGALRQDVLLAAMDYLCLVQSLPEDRRMVVHVIQGCIPLTVWAHHILGLTVQVVWRSKKLWFGKGDAQVIIDPNSSHVIEKIGGSTSSAVSLLESGMEVILAQVPRSITGVPLRSQERHKLLGIGTEFMRRYFYSSTLALESSCLLYTETVQVVVALAIYKSPTLHRVCGPADASGPRESVPCLANLGSWNIYDAASIVFDGIVFSEREVASYVQRLAVFKSEDLAVRDIDLPTSLDARLVFEGGQEIMLERNEMMREDVEILIASLTALLLNVAHIQERGECHDMPLVLDFGNLVSRFGIGFDQLLHGGRIPLEESTVFYSIASLLIGPTFEPRNYDGCFLVSDWGWSVFLSCCDDCDPATVSPESILVHKGVPTNASTQESKLRMADFGPAELSEGSITVLDRGADYLPRCEFPIKTRTEYFASRADSFLLEVQSKYNETDSTSTTLKTSYRSLHASLWGSYSTKEKTRCRHSKESGSRAKLSLGVVTASGYGWGTDAEGLFPHGKGMRSPYYMSTTQGSGIPERICISLVAGDHRARWLVIQNAAKSKERKMMLRESGCCADCALQTLAKLDGRWVLIL